MTERQMKAEAARGQVSATAAQVYEESFVPAVFAQWPGRVLDAARVQRGQTVLDVATGTGVLARHAADRVGPGGKVVGLDVNEGMLDVARSLAPELEWRHGRAESLPFDDNRFDAVVSQFGLMFFEDKVGALREMLRVLRPGGRIAVAVWDGLDHTPGEVTLVRLLERIVGRVAADSERYPFSLGNVDVLKGLFTDAGLPDAVIETHEGWARFPSIDSWMFVAMRGWTMADTIDAATMERLQREARREMQPFVKESGEVEYASPAHIVSARKP